MTISMLLFEKLINSQHLIFFEPTTWDDFGVGFDKVPGGEDYRNRSVLSYHFYVPPDIDVYESFIARMIDLERLGCGGFLTEYAIGHGYPDAINSVAETADFFLQGWTGWEYKAYVGMTGWGWGLFFPNGSIDYSVVNVVSRTYAQAVAGTSNFMSFNPNTRVFNLEYVVKKSCKLPTEIYLNEQLHYPKGFTVLLAPPDVAIWKRVSQNHIHITHTNTTGKQTIFVDIRPTQ